VTYLSSAGGRTERGRAPRKLEPRLWCAVTTMRASVYWWAMMVGTEGAGLPQGQAGASIYLLRFTTSAGAAFSRRVSSL